MHVLYFHQHFTTPEGSGGTRSYELARALVAAGHQVTMVCGRNERSVLNLQWQSEHSWYRGTVDGIDVIALPLEYSNRDSLMRRTRVFLSFAWRSIGIARRGGHDLVFATSTPLTAALPGIALKLLGRPPPFVFEVRDLWPELPKALGMRNPLLLGGMSLLEWMAYRLADGCIGLSPGIVEGIRLRAPSARSIALIPNGCDLEIFKPSRRQPLELTGILPTDFVAGFTGAHGVANGLDALLDAARVLKKMGRNDIKLVLIGDGNRKDSLVARARDEGLDNCVFLPVVKKTEIARITASFDCGLQILANVSAFYYGTSPNKFFDYISAGIPVVCNYPGWLAEMITENDCGIAVPPEDPEALAEALCQLADSEENRNEKGRRSRELAETGFDRRELAKQFVSVIESHDPATP